MIRSILTIALLSLSLSAQGKELCTIAQIMLKPAKNNVCFDRLITQTQNANDRKWLLNLKNTWNPSPKMQIRRIAGGAEFYDGKIFIGSFQWLSMDPPILSINGQLKVGEKSDEKSIAAIVQKLFNEQSTAQFLYQSLMPQAEAQDKNSEKIKQLTILFSIFGQDSKTAEELLSKKDRVLDIIYSSIMTLWQKYVWNMPLKCNADGVQSVPIQFDGDRKFTLSQGKNNQFIIEGLASKKLIATYEQVPQGERNPCLMITSKETDEKYCQPGWEEFFEKFPDARKKYYLKSPTPNVVLDCFAFLPDEKLADNCAEFWMQQDEKYEHYAQATMLPNPISNMNLYECVDDDCKKTVNLSDSQILERVLGEKRIAEIKTTNAKQIKEKVAAYIKFLKEKGISRADDVCSEEACVLPKLDSLSVKDQREARRIFQDLQKSDLAKTMIKETLYNVEALGMIVTGAKLLGECCKSDACRAHAKNNYSIELNKAKETVK